MDDVQADISDQVETPASPEAAALEAVRAIESERAAAEPEGDDTDLGHEDDGDLVDLETEPQGEEPAGQPSQEPSSGNPDFKAMAASLGISQDELMRRLYSPGEATGQEPPASGAPAEKDVLEGLGLSTSGLAEQLADAVGDPDAAEAIADAVKEFVKPLAEKVSVQQDAATSQHAQAEQAAFLAEADEVFAQDERRYGKGSSAQMSDSDPGIKERVRTASLARLIMDGARANGIRVEGTEALTYAHRAFAYEDADNTARSRVAKEVHDRSKNLDVPPGRATAGGAPRSKDPESQAREKVNRLIKQNARR